jgi:hypothetical protein
MLAALMRTCGGEPTRSCRRSALRVAPPSDPACASPPVSSPMGKDVRLLVALPAAPPDEPFVRQREGPTGGVKRSGFPLPVTNAQHMALWTTGLSSP